MTRARGGALMMIEGRAALGVELCKKTAAGPTRTKTGFDTDMTH